MTFLTPRYDPTLVLASIGIATLSSYLMLELARRVRLGSRVLARSLWVGGSLVMGTGIWSMHFIGMLAYSLPIALGYAVSTTLLSWLAAIGASAASLWVASGQALTNGRLAAGSLAMGASICLMHYIGMAAIDVVPGIVWNPWLVVASALIAWASSAVALTLFFWLRRFASDRRAGHQALAATVMGLAICGMHYTGMAAAGIEAGSICRSANEISASRLGVVVVLSSLGLLALALLTSTVEARIHADTRRLAKSLEQFNIELERRAALLDQAEDIALIGSKQTDLLTGEATLSAGLYRLFGETPSPLAVRPGWIAARVPLEERELVRATRESVAADAGYEFQHRIVRKDGAMRTVLHRGRLERDAHGRPLRLHATLQDVTSHREAAQALHDLAHIDLATRLPNRTALVERLEELIVDAQRDGGSVVLLVTEIDQFRLAHESLGYAAGDHLLRAVAQRLLAQAPAAQTVAHLGAGQFAIVLRGLGDGGEAAAQGMAGALMKAMDDPFLISSTEIFATCSIGIALCPNDADVAADLLDRAGATAQRARQLDEQRICFYTPDADARASARLANEAGLRRALDRRELYVVYQPQVELATGRIIGLEALARWKDASRGDISPGEFIPLAERTGLILPIGEFVLRTACAANVAWQAAGLPPVRIGVNLSMHQLRQPDIDERIQAILAETGLDPRWLGLEITESMLLDDVDHVAATLLRLKALGVEIALDDFGTGYSNLSYLSKLPIDILKIDRSFVHEATAPEHDVALTRALIDMAHGLDMKVIAEGVENESQLALLVAGGCDQIQGFYFSRPGSAIDIAAMLRDGKRLAPHLLTRKRRERTLLLVDDDESLVASLGRLLRPDGYHIIAANSGAQGLRALADNHVDVILAGQGLPGMPGVEFLRRARALYPEAIRMSLSGPDELQSITDAINEGSVLRVVTRPWDDDRLRAHVNEAFRQKEAVDERRELVDELRAENESMARTNLELRQAMASREERIEQAAAPVLELASAS